MTIALIIMKNMSGSALIRNSDMRRSRRMSSIAERRLKANDFYRMNKRKIWLIGSVILLATLFFSVFFMTKTVTAQRNSDRIKLVTCIEIQKGDTLWKIASDYMSEDYDNINDYIEEIKNSNGLLTDEIHAGNYIIVPYYTNDSYPSLSCKAE
jgi:hypothetical protein